MLGPALRRRLALSGVTLAIAAAAASPSAAGSPVGGPPVAAPPVAQRVASRPSPEVRERLKAVGLDPSDPNLGARLKTMAASTGPVYVQSRVVTMTSGRAGPTRASRIAGTAGAGANLVAPSRVAQAPFEKSISGSILGIYDDHGTILGPNPTLSSSHGNTWPGRYFFLVRTSQKVAIKGGPMFSMGNASFSLGCTPKFGVLFLWAGAADDTNFIAGTGLQPLSSGSSSYNYYVGLDLDGGLPTGQPRPAQLTLSFENVVTSPTNVTLSPDTVTATVDVTIDHTPALTGLGMVYPWGSTGIGTVNATLGNSGSARVGSGNWQTQTSGDDLVGVSVQLAPGWKVTSTTIKSAVSATAPQDLSPDNTWRGASVTTTPQGSDLRSAVHWHYSGIDSLDYTMEWQLSGPAGQRPLLTMAKNGSCDN